MYFFYSTFEQKLSFEYWWLQELFLFFDSHHTPLQLHTSPIHRQTRLQHAIWLGNTTGLLMVADNDIYVRASPDSPEEYRLTDSGVPGIIYNGVPDWLYQEEVLPRPEVTWPSADGSHLLYASFNDSKVTGFEFPWFADLDNNKKHEFPPTRSLKYPTPGSINPDVELWLIDFANTTNSYVNNATNATVLVPVKTRLKPPPALDGL